MPWPLRDFVRNALDGIWAAEAEASFDDPDISQGSLFYGAAGIAYFLLQAFRAGGEADLLRHANRFCGYAESFADGPFSKVHSELPNHQRSIAVGSGGIGYTRALLAASMGAPAAARAGIEMFADAWSGTEAMGRDMPLELHRGAAGFCCAATDLLERMPELGPAATDVLLLVQKRSAMKLFEDLEQPLSERHDEIGMAHGVAGQLYACMRVPAPPEIVARRMNELIDFAIDQPPLIQWPSALDTRQLDWLPVSLCRGLAGMLVLLCAAAKAFPSERFSEFAGRAAFMLRKLPAGHPSLCCGATGQAVAVDHYAALSGCSTSRRWSRRRLRWGAEAPRLPLFQLWQGKAGIALAAFAVAGKGAMPLFARP